MAWNTPGSGSPKKDEDGSGRNGQQRNPWQSRRGRGGGGGFGDWFNNLRGLPGGGPWRWIGLAAVLWLAFSGFVLVAEQERGVVLRFGLFSRVLQPGPHFKLPWPIERVTKVQATKIQSFGESVLVLTSDENIVRVDINVQYRINDPQKFLFGTRNSREVLEQAALSTVREQIGRSSLDTVLGAREQLAVSAKTQLQKSLDAYRTGLYVTELNLPNARPPEEVKPAFDDVNSAQQDKDRSISEAQAYAAKLVPEARGQAAGVRTVAEGYKTAAIARATGDAERFSLLVEQYRGAPEVTRKRLWLEAVQQVLANNRKIVGGDSRQLIYVPMVGQGGGASAAASPVITPDMIAPTVSATPGDADPRGERTSRSSRDEEPGR
ncbi:FtsH protease activity modulator HflK [Luteimonas aquatica]|uniref:FtsH protease activity modulator HflK n=1 Tax=Luteimonas aquatica TaxID=450364 RepID=UPI001F5A3F11|nr:FtsH protease activity modulator HflK [Luteimonas aquatica]